LALFFRHRSVSDPVFPCSSFRHLFSQPTSLAAEIIFHRHHLPQKSFSIDIICRRNHFPSNHSPDIDYKIFHFHSPPRILKILSVQASGGFFTSCSF